MPGAVRSRADHGFRDLEAARHMYKEFADAEVARRHVVNSTEDPATLASRLFIFKWREMRGRNSLVNIVVPSSEVRGR